MDLDTALVRLKATEIKPYRQQAVIQQGHCCPLCEQPLTQEDAVLDHNHTTGQIRQAIHRFCNTFLGKIENNIARNRIQPDQLTAILRNYEQYVKTAQPILHPTHLTPEERALKAKKRAKKRRVAKKQQKTLKT